MTDQHSVVGAKPAVQREPGAAMSRNALEIHEILRIVGERYRIILAVGLCGLLLGLGVSLLATPLYRASALLEYDPSATESLDNTRGAASRSFIANQQVIATQLGLLRSDALTRRVAEDLNLAAVPAYGGTTGTRDERVKRAAARISASTVAESVKDSMLLKVSIASPDPAMAARIASGMAQGFIASSLERRYNSSAYARHFLSDQLARTKTALEESERAVDDYAIRSNLFRTPGQIVDGKSNEGVTLSVTDLAAMEEALNQARVKRIATESAWRNGSADHALETAPALSPLIVQRSSLQAQYAQNSRLFKPDYPAMQELAAQIERLDAAIAAEKSRGTGDQAAQLLAAYRTALQAETDLAARVANAKGQVQDERSRSIQYNILQREADTNRTLYDALLQRFKEVGVAGGIGQSNVSLVDDAQIPQRPFSPNIALNCGVGLFFGLVAGLAAAFVVHLLFDTIGTSADAREKLGLRVLGNIPMDASGARMIESLTDPKSAVTEAYYSTLTALKFARAKGMPRTVFVTSAHPGEGKSTTAYAIAVTSARLGRKVLLIDADLRRPTFSSRTTHELGFAHLLASEDALATYARPTALDNLSLLPVGSFTGSPAELLSSVRLGAIVAEAAAHYDQVVLDGPPVLGLADAPLLGSVAEGTVVVVESRKTRTNTIHEMIRRLDEAGASVLGIVLTKIARSSGSYGYQYQYQYDRASEGSGKPRFDPGLSLGQMPGGE